MTFPPPTKPPNPPNHTRITQGKIFYIDLKVIQLNSFLHFLGPSIGVQPVMTDSSLTTPKGGKVTTGPGANAAKDLKQTKEEQLVLSLLSVLLSYKIM